MSQLHPLPADPTATRVSALPPPFACTWSSDGVDGGWVQVAGELDLAVVPRLTEALRDAQHEARLVVLDLRELTFLDTAGVHAIVDAGFDARCDGRRLFLVGAPARVQRVFGLTATSHQVNVFDGSPGELPVQAFFQLARRSIPA